jgi:hypothetical protein
LSKSVTFPFGWIRGMDDENWQLLWNPETGIFFAKGAISKRVINLGESSNWVDAKALADKVQNEAQIYSQILINESP